MNNICDEGWMRFQDPFYRLSEPRPLGTYSLVVDMIIVQRAPKKATSLPKGFDPKKASSVYKGIDLDKEEIYIGALSGPSIISLAEAGGYGNRPIVSMIQHGVSVAVVDPWDFYEASAVISAVYQDTPTIKALLQDASLELPVLNPLLIPNVRDLRAKVAQIFDAPLKEVPGGFADAPNN